VESSNGAATPHFPHSATYKNRLPNEDKMIQSVTYNNISPKCYINLFTWFHIVPVEMGSSHILARAIDNFYRVSKPLKKIRERFYSNFLTITDISPSVTSTFQSILSPASTSRTLTISLGNPTRRDLDLGFA